MQRIAPHGVAKTQNLVYNVCIMVTLKRIFADEQMYTWAMELLRQSFPPEERRDDQLQRQVMQHADYRLCAILDDGTPRGVVGYWDTPDFLYFENFCVQSECRNKGVGSATLRLLTQSLRKPFILEIELPTDELTRRRKAFYQRNGMVENPFPHVQPHYRATDPDLPLMILTYGKPISQTQYDGFRKYLDENVDVR